MNRLLYSFCLFSLPRKPPKKVSVKAVSKFIQLPSRRCCNFYSNKNRFKRIDKERRNGFQRNNDNRDTFEHNDDQNDLFAACKGFAVLSATVDIACGAALFRCSFALTAGRDRRIAEHCRSQTFLAAT